MDDALGVEVTDGQCDLHGIELDDLFREAFRSEEMFVQLATSDKRHDEVQSHVRLEHILHAD